MAEVKKENMPTVNDQYQRLIAARNFHYENLNKWMITFYAIIGALFLALYTLHASEHLHRHMELCVAIVGYVVSLCALLSIKGYHYWEYHWIERLFRFERQVYHFDHDEMQVYSAFADKIKHDNPKRLIDSANVSTTKVSIFVTLFVTVLWGMMIIYFCNNLWIQWDRYVVVPIAIVISFGMTWLLMWGGSKWLHSDLGNLDDLKHPKKETDMKKTQTKGYKKRRKYIAGFNVLWAFIVILIALVGIWAILYFPHFEHFISGNNADWGNFGDFFWGLGMVCLTGLNVYIFWQIEQQIRRDRLVSNLRSLVEKIRDVQSTKNENEILMRVEGFKFAVGSTIESGLLSEETIDYIKEMLVHLRPEQFKFETSLYFCEAIVYAISVNKNIKENSTTSYSDVFAEIGLMEKISQWEKTEKEHVADQKEVNKENTTMRSFADYLQRELLAAKRLSVLYPKARVYPQKRIPQSDLVMDALVVPDEGGKEMIVEIKTRLNESIAQKAVQQLLLCEQAYKNAYNKEPILAVAFEEDIKKTQSARVIQDIVDKEFRPHGIIYIVLPDIKSD